MPSAACPGGGGPDGRGDPGRACGALSSRPPGTHPGRVPGSPSPRGSGFRGGKGKPPPIFDVSARRVFGARAAGLVRDPRGERALEKPRVTPRVPHGAGPTRPGTALVFLGRQRRKNNQRSDRVRNGNVFAAFAFSGEIREPFLSPSVGGEGLKAHGRGGTRGRARRPLLPPKAWPGPQSRPSSPVLRELRGSGSGLGRRRGRGSCLKVSHL